jgi:hypothetical protein
VTLMGWTLVRKAVVAPPTLIDPPDEAIPFAKTTRVDPFRVTV